MLLLCMYKKLNIGGGFGVKDMYMCMRKHLIFGAGFWVTDMRYVCMYASFYI